MLYAIFLFLIWAIALFHVWEHRRFIEELRKLQRVLAEFSPEKEKLQEKLKGRDWRIVSLERSKAGLRRAFVVKDAFSLLRYAVPVGFIILTLLVLETWVMAGVYFAMIVMKWFMTKTVLDVSPVNARYDVTLFGMELFGEPLPEQAPERTLIGFAKKKKD